MLAFMIMGHRIDVELLLLELMIVRDINHLIMTTRFMDIAAEGLDAK